MNYRRGFRRLAAVAVLCLSCDARLVADGGPIVIAHRGASAYLPEHTLASKALAYGMRADYLEQDVVLTKDDVPIVLHDVDLNAVTDVADVFPHRARDDGRFLAIDFTLDEIKRLQVHERIDPQTGQKMYPRRFPLHRSRFAIPTLAEEIELIQGLNQSTGRTVGIYTEIKSPAWHRKHGKDISKIVLKLLDAYGYRSKEDAAYVQCFDPVETRRMRVELKSPLKLVQLIDGDRWLAPPVQHDDPRVEERIQQIAQYADGVGPGMPLVVQSHAERPLITNFVSVAHAHGLEVHVFTLRADALPKYARSFDHLLDLFLHQAGVDGAFTDFPDRIVSFLAR